MGITNTEAFFHTCPKCGNHGSIFCCGRESFDICSKAAGYFAVQMFLNSGHLNATEAISIVEQIEDSNLPDEGIQIDHTEEDETELLQLFGFMPMSPEVQ